MDRLRKYGRYIKMHLCDRLNMNITRTLPHGLTALQVVPREFAIEVQAVITYLGLQRASWIAGVRALRIANHNRCPCSVTDVQRLFIDRFLRLATRSIVHMEAYLSTTWSEGMDYNISKYKRALAATLKTWPLLP